jgi:hypothetical protein
VEPFESRGASSRVSGGNRYWRRLQSRGAS